MVIINGFMGALTQHIPFWQNPLMLINNVVK
jgi:hypothetical protein